MTATAPPIRIALVDDHSLVREGIRALLAVLRWERAGAVIAIR